MKLLRFIQFVVEVSFFYRELERAACAKLQLGFQRYFCFVFVCFEATMAMVQWSRSQ